jgi:hypothetical protein
MKNHFTGKEIKDLVKPAKLQPYDMVFRFSGHYLDLEVITGAPIRSTHSLEVKQDLDQKGVWVSMYASGCLSQWRFFLDSLKNTDEVIFYTLRNDSPLLKEHGIGSQQLIARVKQRRKDGTLVKARDCILDSVNYTSNQPMEKVA